MNNEEIARIYRESRRPEERRQGDEDIMTVDDLSAMLGFSRSKIYKLVQSGELPAFKVSRSWRFSRKEIKLWLTAYTVPAFSEKQKNEWDKAAAAVMHRKKEKLEEEMERRLKKSFDSSLDNAGEDKKANKKIPENMTVLQLLKQSGLFEGFTDSEIHDFLLKNWPRKRLYRKGEPVLLETEKLNDIYIVDKGCLATLLDISDVDEPAKKYFRSGAMLGLDVMMSDIRTSYMDVWAEEDTEVVMLQTERLMEYMYENYTAFLRFATNAMRLLSDENIRWMKQTRLLMEKNIRDKIMYYLRLEERKSNTTPITLRENRQGMASHLGINRSALSRELLMMKADGLIDYERNNFLILKSPHKNDVKRSTEKKVGETVAESRYMPGYDDIQLRGQEVQLPLKQIDEGFESYEEKEERLAAERSRLGQHIGQKAPKRRGRPRGSRSSVKRDGV